LTANISVVTLQDQLDEPAESLEVAVKKAAGSGDVTLADGTAKVTIADDDETPTPTVTTGPSASMTPTPTPTVTPTPTATPTPGAGPPNTKLTRTRIKAKKGRATFTFAASGSTTGFQCALTKRGKKPAFKPCRSPKTYKHVRPRRYVFRVRAVGPGGRDATPATKRFKLRR
jgi:hypothetical protein